MRKNLIIWQSTLPSLMSHNAGRISKQASSLNVRMSPKLRPLSKKVLIEMGSHFSFFVQMIIEKCTTL